MKNIFYIFFILLSTLSFSQKNQVQEIIESHVKNLGGELIRSITSVSSDQIIYSNNMEIPQSSKIIIEKGIYQETLFPSNKMTVAFLNNKGWQINPYVSSEAVDLKKQEINYYKLMTRFFSPICNYYFQKEKSYVKNIELVKGNFNIENKKCLKVKVTYKTGFTEFLFLSEKDHMIRKIQNNFGETIFSSYKKIDGISVPMNSYVKNAKGIIEVDVTSLKFNEKIDDKIFEKKEN